MDSSDLDSAGTSTSGGSSSSEMYPPMDPERLLRLAFTEYHNNATFSCNRYLHSAMTTHNTLLSRCSIADSRKLRMRPQLALLLMQLNAIRVRVLGVNSGSAFLGERLSFHNEATTSAAVAAAHLANTTYHHHHHHHSSIATNNNALLQTSSCSIIAADFALAVSTSPQLGGADIDASPLTTTEDCSSTAEDESYALGYDCLSESDSSATEHTEGLQKWVVASSWGRVAHSDVVLQPCPKASPVGSGAAAVQQHLQSPTSW
eukprot:8421-Heterococcus_DN1.PRE.1